MAEKIHIWPDKDPHEVLDYDHDHKPKTGDDPVIQSTAEVVQGDVEVDFTEHFNGVQKTWLRGGTDGSKCIIRLFVTTRDGRKIEEPVRIRIREKNKPAAVE